MFCSFIFQSVLLFGIVISVSVEQISRVDIYLLNNNRSATASEEDSNFTLYNTIDDQQTISNNVEERKSPPFWCPPNYELFYYEEKWYHMCKPRPCCYDSCYSSFKRDKKLPAHKPDIPSAKNKKSSRECESSSVYDKYLKLCETKVKLNANEFELQNDETLLDKVDNRTLSVSEYFIQAESAIVCKESSTKRNYENIIWNCATFTVSNKSYKINENGSLIIQGIPIAVSPEFYSVNNDTADVCFPLTIQSNDCALILIEPPEAIKLLNDFSLHVVKSFTNVSYPIGEFVLSEDENFAFICVKNVYIFDDVSMYVHGITSAISSIFCFVTLIIHLIFPSINHRARSLVCLITSLFLFYLMITVEAFIHDIPRGVGRMVTFSCKYVFILSTFCWLNILAFELWHAFHKCRGFMLPGARGGKKRWILLKYGYGCGVPLAFCFAMIGLSLSPDVLKKLGITMNLTNILWFPDRFSKIVFYCAPIFIILVVNLVLFICTLFNIRKLNRGTDILNSKVSKKLFSVFVKLFVVMGLCWITEVASSVFFDETSLADWFVPDAINCLQGVAMFVIYVCKNSTLRVIRKKIRGEEYGSQSTRSTSSQERSRRHLDASPSFALRSVNGSIADNNRDQIQLPQNDNLVNV